MQAADAPERRIYGVVSRGLASADVGKESLLHVGDHAVGDFFEEVQLLERQGESGQGDEGVAAPASEPRIACNDVSATVALHDELLGGILEATDEVEARGATLGLGGVKGLNLRWIHWRGADAEVELLARHFRGDGARTPEIFMTVVATFQLLFVFNVVVPVWMMLILNRFRELEIDRRVVVIHAEAYAVIHLLEIRANIVVGVGELVDVAEGQQRFYLESDFFHFVKEGVFDEQTVGFALEQHGLLEVELPDAVVINRHAVGGEVLQIFVAHRVDDLAFVLMDAEMEIHVVDHDVLVDAGDQQMAFAVDVVLRHDEEAVVFAGWCWQKLRFCCNAKSPAPSRSRCSPVCPCQKRYNSSFRLLILESL